MTNPTSRPSGASTEPARRASFMLLPDFERVEEWCRSVRTLFDGEVPYLVGSVNERPDFRDIDLRLILSDEDFDSEWADPVKVRLMNRAITTWGQRETGLPIDFQIQRRTEANEQFPGFRNPMGLRDWSVNIPAGVRAGAASTEVKERPGLHSFASIKPQLAQALSAYDDERNTGLGDYEHEASVLHVKMLEAGICVVPLAALTEATERPDLRPSVAAFAALMESVLRDNDHKGGWQDCRPEWLLMRLRQEVAELDEAMQKGTIARRDESGRTSDWPADIAREAADVANFAMMIADVRGALTGATSPPPTEATERSDLDRERLARALASIASKTTGYPLGDYDNPEDREAFRLEAQTIATEYAALTESTSPSEPSGEEA